MNEKQYFTATERKEFLKVYRSLFATARPLIGEKEFFFLRQHITEAVLSGSYLRDSNGINRLYHDIATALILSQEVGLDRSTLAAVLTCNLVVENRLSFEAVENLFGTDCVKIIRGLIKANSLYAKQETVQSDNFRNLLLTFAEDVRVIIIMIADRLCLMRMINHHPNNRFRENVAYEASYLYAPLAHRLGLYRIKTELEDLALKYTQREEYDRIAHKLSETKESRDKYIREFIAPIKEKLATAGLKFEIKGRVKSISSILNKIRKQNVDIEGIYDLFAIRVVLDTPPENESADCWHVYSIITDMYRPNPKRLKDWLSVPKSNGYESLHITVWGPEDRWVEVQIRTKRMDEIAERGLAAHWKYKEAGKGAKATGAVDQKMSWLRQMVNLQQELSDPKEYFEALKVDVFSDEVFVFTPKGDVVDLPKGSIPIDFAYRIHTEVGHHCVGAKVNGKLVPLEYKLKNGDIVSVITNKANNGPSRDWLNIVASSETRSKIRSWFKKEKREENIEQGLELIKDEAKRLGYAPKTLLKEGRLQQVAEKLNNLSEDDLLAALGYGGITLRSVMTKLIELYKKDLKEATPPDVSKMLSELKTPQHSSKRNRSSHGVLVEGESGLLVRLARCCNPIPGDPITGFVTKGRGVSVHRSDCPNVLRDNDLSRMIEVSWDIGLDKDYTVEIEIVCNDKSGVLAELLAVPSEMKINIHSVNANPNRSNKTSTVVMGLDVKNATQVAQIMTKMRRLKNVYSVSRALSSHPGQ